MEILFLFSVMILGLIMIYRNVKKLINHDYYKKSSPQKYKTLNIANSNNYYDKRSINNSFNKYNSKKAKIQESLDKVILLKNKIEKLNKAYIIINNNQNIEESSKQIEVLKYLITQYNKLCVAHLYLFIIVSISDLEESVSRKQFNIDTYIFKLKDNFFKEIKKIRKIDVIKLLDNFTETDKAIIELLKYIQKIENDIALLITHSILQNIKPIDDEIGKEINIVEINIKNDLNKEYDRIFSEIEVNKILEKTI